MGIARYNVRLKAVWHVLIIATTVIGGAFGLIKFVYFRIDQARWERITSAREVYLNCNADIEWIGEVKLKTPFNKYRLTVTIDNPGKRRAYLIDSSYLIIGSNLRLSNVSDKEFRYYANKILADRNVGAFSVSKNYEGADNETIGVGRLFESGWCFDPQEKKVIKINILAPVQYRSVDIAGELICVKDPTWIGCRFEVGNEGQLIRSYVKYMTPKPVAKLYDRLVEGLEYQSLENMSEKERDEFDRISGVVSTPFEAEWIMQ
jgi:hypothetical protein